MVRFASWNGQRKARLGAVRRTPANKPGRRELVRVARREAPPCFREGTRADKEQMVASLGAPSRLSKKCPRIVGFLKGGKSASQESYQKSPALLAEAVEASRISL